MIDCTGRENTLSLKLLSRGYEYIEGNIVFEGGFWNEKEDRFTSIPFTLDVKRIAYKVKNQEIFFLGATCPLEEIIDDDEAKNGSSQYQEDRKSLTNSKWSLEHTLPRTIALANQHSADM